jgi:hypothetical protein
MADNSAQNADLPGEGKTAAPVKSRQSTRARVKRPQMRKVKAQTVFLRELARLGVVLKAAQAAKVGRQTVYGWLVEDKRFKELYEQALEDAVDALESEARRRAEEGVIKPVFQGGKQVGSIREYSDALMITLLKGRRPDVFKERVDLDGKIKTGKLIDPKTSTDDELDARIETAIQARVAARVKALTESK